MSSFENLPNELIECIVSLLEITDVCSIRCTSTTLAMKATQDHFRSHFCRSSKVVEVGLRSLETLAAVSGMPNFTFILTQLTLLGIDENVDQGKEAAEVCNIFGIQRDEMSSDYQQHYDKLISSGTAAKILSDAVVNIGQHGQPGGLQALTLAAFRTPLLKQQHAFTGHDLT